MHSQTLETKKLFQLLETVQIIHLYQSLTTEKKMNSSGNKKRGTGVSSGSFISVHCDSQTSSSGDQLHRVPLAVIQSWTWGHTQIYGTYLWLFWFQRRQRRQRRQMHFFWLSDMLELIRQFLFLEICANSFWSFLLALCVIMNIQYKVTSALCIMSGQFPAKSHWKNQIPITLFKKGYSCSCWVMLLKTQVYSLACAVINSQKDCSDLMGCNWTQKKRF